MATILGYEAIERNPYISSSFTPPRYPHSHLFFELSFCVSGFSTNTINDIPFPFKNGSCVILRPGDTHSLTNYDEKIYEHIDLYVSVEKFIEICGCCDSSLYEKILNEEKPIFFTISNESFTYLFNQSLLLKEMIANKDDNFKLIYVSLISILLSEWVKTKAYIEKFKPNWLKELLPKYNNVSFLQKNISQIASETGFSLPYFSTQFKKYMEVSAISYLIKKRIHISKDLLLNNPRLRILDISMMLGFENPSTFSKHFLEEFKISPKKYRMETQKKSM